MAHIHDLIDFTVEVYIVHEGKVLLRRHDKYKIWLSVGGHIELNEDPNQAALREVMEEVGLAVSLYDSTGISGTTEGVYTNLIPPVFMNRHQINNQHEHVSLVYFAKAPTVELSQNISTEISEDIRWFSSNELDKLSDISPTVHRYARTALKRLS